MKGLALQTAGGARIPLRRACTIGGGAEADVILAAAEIAPVHARIEPEAGGWAIRAVGGAVRIGGAPIDHASLRAGDRIELGGACLAVVERRFRDAGWAVIVAALLIAIAGGALAVRPGPRTPASAQVELLPGGSRLRWSGREARLWLRIPVDDPRRSFVELEIGGSEEGGARLVEVDGRVVARIPAGGRRRIPLVPLQAGENLVRIRAADGGALGAIEARALATPVPDCGDGGCAARVDAALARAERLERARNAAPANLYEAWRWLRRARGYALSSGSGEVAARVEARLAAVEAELDRRCAALEFAGARHLALADRAGAARVAGEMLRAFPGDEHGCRASGERLRALAEGGG